VKGELMTEHKLVKLQKKIVKRWNSNHQTTR